MHKSHARKLIVEAYRQMVRVYRAAGLTDLHYDRVAILDAAKMAARANGYYA